MLTAQFYLQKQRHAALWCGSKAACRTPVPLQRLWQSLHVTVPTPLFFSKCFHIDDELADDSPITKTGYFSNHMCCEYASDTTNLNNETKFEHRWTNTFIRIFDLFVSPQILSKRFLEMTLVLETRERERERSCHFLMSAHFSITGHRSKSEDESMACAVLKGKFWPQISCLCNDVEVKHNHLCIEKKKKKNAQLSTNKHFCQRLVQPGAVRSVLWRHWMHLSFMHPVTSEDHFHCTRLYMYYPGQKNRYSRDIHEIDPQCDHVISCDIDFNLQRKLATRRYRGSRRCRTEARYRRISHDWTVDQPHEFLSCNDFFGPGSRSTLVYMPSPIDNGSYAKLRHALWRQNLASFRGHVW